MPEQGDGGELGSGGGPLNGVREVPIDQSNLLLRGSRLRNTKWVLGIVAYTGKESKIAQNARAPPSKQSNLDKVSMGERWRIRFASRWQWEVACRRHL